MKPATALDKLYALQREVHDFDQLGPQTDHRFAYIEGELREIINQINQAEIKTPGGRL